MMQANSVGRERRRMGPRSLGLAALLSVMPPAVAGSLERSALAADTDAATAVALKQFEAGRRAFEKREYEAALVAFRESNSLAASPNSRLYMARCYREIGRFASAYTTYRLAAREAQDRLTATQEKRYVATREAADSEAAEIEAKVPRLTIAVSPGVADTLSIQENGADVPKAAWGVPIETDPGEVTIEATGPRLVPFKRIVRLAPGAQERVEVAPTRTPTATLRVALRTRPTGLAIAMDGTAVDVGEAEKPTELDVGEHTVAVNAPGYAPFEWTKRLTDGEDVSVEVTLRPKAIEVAGATTPRWLFFTAAGGAAAALGVGTAFAVDAKSMSDAQQALDPLLRSQSQKSQIGALSTAANVLFVAAGALGVGAVVLAITTKWRDDDGARDRAALVPWVGPQGAGVTLTGRL